jgi:hypothetical protein
MGSNNTLLIIWTKIIQSKVFTKYPHEGIAFLFKFEFIILGGKERFFGLSARLESFF